MLLTIFLVMCAVVVIVPAVLIFHDDYHDGLVGRVSLVGIAFAGAVMFANHAENPALHIQRETRLMVASVAVFLIWHIYRFWRGIRATKRAELGLVDRRHHGARADHA